MPFHNLAVAAFPDLFQHKLLSPGSITSTAGSYWQRPIHSVWVINFAGQSLLNQIGEGGEYRSSLAMPAGGHSDNNTVVPVPLSRKLTWFCILSRIAF